MSSEAVKTVGDVASVATMLGSLGAILPPLAALAWAQLGDKSKALLNLSLAADAGWAHPQFTDEQLAFEILKDRPDWQAVMERIHQNALGGDH